MTGWRVGRSLIIGMGIAAGVVSVLGGGAVHAAVITVEGASNCDGPESWVASWFVSITSDSPGETWRLDSSAGAGDPRPTADPVVLEQVQSMDEPIAHLDAVATLLESGTTVSATATVERPTACISAPAPTNAVAAEAPPAPGEPDEVAAGVTIESAEAEPTANSAFVAPAAQTVPSLATIAMRTDSVGGAPEHAELPATGSTSGVLVSLAFACVAGGALLLRLGRRSVPVLSGAPTAPHPRQLASRRTSLTSPQFSDSRRQP